MSAFPTVEGVRVADLLAAEDQPGAFAYFTAENAAAYGAPDGLFFVCPCGCRGLGVVTLGGKGWSWNGDRDRPTVTPSVYFNRGEPGEWHGYLTEGRWVGC